MQPTIPNLLSLLEEHKPVGVSLRAVLQELLDAEDSRLTGKRIIRMSLNIKQPTFEEGWGTGFKRGMEHAIQTLETSMGINAEERITLLRPELEALKPELEVKRAGSDVRKMFRKDAGWQTTTADDIAEDMREFRYMPTLAFQLEQSAPVMVAPKCDCGGAKLNTTHSDWCSIKASK